MKKRLTTFLVVGFVFVLWAPASAADYIGAWSFYGSARMGVFYKAYSDEAGGQKTLEHGLMGGSTFLGATVKKGALGGGFEFGLCDSDNSSQDWGNPFTRLMYGTIDFSKAQLLIGQTWTPVNMFYSNQVYNGDIDLLDVGGVLGVRHPMVQLSTGGFKFALVKQASQSLVGAGDRLSTKIPKIEAAYHFGNDVFFADIQGGYQIYEVENTVANKTYDVNSYVAAIGAGVNMGPAYIKISGHTGSNVAQYGLYSGIANASANAVYDAASDSIKDVKTVGGLGVIGFKASNMVTLEAGVGYVSFDSEMPGVLEKDETMAYYANCSIQVVPGLLLVPEIGYYDYRKNLAGADQGNMWYGGLKAQIDF